MGSTAGWAEVYVPDEDDDAGADVYGEAIAASIRPKVVPTYASTAARDAAATPLIAATPNVRMLAIVDGVGLSRYLGPRVGGGQDWEWVGNVTPVDYVFGVGISPEFNLTGIGNGGDYANYTTATYQFTPSRTGWADVDYEYDVSSLNAFYGASYARVRFNPGGGAPTVNLGDKCMGFSGVPRYIDTRRIGKRVRLTAGQQASLFLDVASFSTTAGSNQWRFNSFYWQVVQQ